jgi:hypothetical protein
MAEAEQSGLLPRFTKQGGVSLYQRDGSIHTAVQVSPLSCVALNVLITAGDINLSSTPASHPLVQQAIAAGPIGYAAAEVVLEPISGELLRTRPVLLVLPKYKGLACVPERHNMLRIPITANMDMGVLAGVVLLDAAYTHTRRTWPRPMSYWINYLVALYLHRRRPSLG